MALRRQRKPEATTSLYAGAVRRGLLWWTTLTSVALHRHMTSVRQRLALPRGIKCRLALLAVSGGDASMDYDSTLYVGLDVHKESITVTYAIGAGRG